MSEQTIHLIARLLGNVTPFLLVGLAIAVYQKRSRRLDKLPKQPILFLALLGVLVALMLYLKRTALPEEQVEVMRVEQPAEGATDADLTPAFVQSTALYIVGRINEEEPDFRGTSTSSVIEKDGKRLGVIRIQMGDVTPIVSVMGFKDGQLVRVTCSGSGAVDLNVDDPTCARAMLAEFGTAPDG